RLRHPRARCERADPDAATGTRPQRLLTRAGLAHDLSPALDEKGMSVLGHARLDEHMSVLLTERWNVDYRKAVGRLQPDPSAGLHRLQAPTRLEHGQGTLQAAQIVAVVLVQSNGFHQRRPFLAPLPGSSVIRAAASAEAESPASRSAANAVADGAGTGTGAAAIAWIGSPSDGGSRDTRSPRARAADHFATSAASSGPLMLGLGGDSLPLSRADAKAVE